MKHDATTGGTAAPAMTTDTLFNGRLTCLQHQDGYRFSLDSVLVAHFTPPALNSRILDLGTGCGIIGLIVLYRWGHLVNRLYALEYQPRLAALARENFLVNGFSDQVELLTGNVSGVEPLIAVESCDLTICNPPFYPVHSGRTSRGEEARLARHQISASLDDFARFAARATRNGGLVTFIYPAERTVELQQALLSARLEPKVVQYVYSYPEPQQEASLVLIRAVKNGKTGCRILHPFYVYASKGGEYSPEMAALYRG